MSKISTLTTIGVIVLVSPYLGLPMKWLTPILIAMGALIILISYLLRRDRVMPVPEAPIAPVAPAEPPPMAETEPEPVPHHDQTISSMG